MKIGIDARLWNETGVGRYIRNLIENLVQIDKENKYVLFLRKKEFLELEISSENVEKKIADIQWHSLSEQIQFASVLKREQLDLVHFPYFSVPIAYGGPFIVTIHDLILHHFPTGESTTLPIFFYKAKLAGYRYIISKAARKAKKIITVSNATKQEIIEHLHVNQQKIAVTYEGISYEDTNILTIHRESKPYFLYVGNAYPHKNLERMLKAFLDSKPIIPNVQLLFVGKEDYFYKKIKHKVHVMNLQDSVYFLGEVTDTQLMHLYKHALAYIVPSLMEGFGLPGLEAMKCKCLVIASKIPVFEEIYKDVPLYFDPLSSYDLASRMQEVVQKGRVSYTGNIERGVERSKYFSWKKMAQETLKIYNTAVSL